MNKLTHWFASLTFATVAGSVQALPIITVDGKDWLQPLDFVNLSWNDISAVCDPLTGACNGSLLGNDITGWTWADYGAVASLFNSFMDPDCVPPAFPGVGTTSNLCLTGASVVQDLLSSFDPTSYDVTATGSGESITGIIRQRSELGFTFTLGAGYFIDSSGVTPAGFRWRAFGQDSTDYRFGAWLFRQPDTSSVPLPSTVALFALAVVTLGVTRRNH